MSAQQPVQNPAKVNRLIHFALAMGVTLLTIVMVVLRQTGGWTEPDQPLRIGMILAGVGVTLIAASLAILRPRIDVRGGSESKEEFWNPTRTTGALFLWSGIEAGALISVVGYALTGFWTPLAVVPIALIAFFFTRPSTMDEG
jgi:hypothetical protein